MNSNLIICEYKKAGDLLLSEGFYRQSITMYWIACRYIIFDILSKNGIHYNSTRNALVEFLKINSNSPINSLFWFLDSISTLCEWNPAFKVDKKQANIIKNMFNNILIHYEQSNSL